LPKGFAEQHSFETYIKQRYKLTEKIPGLRHTLFDWGIKEPAATGKTDIPDLSLDSEAIAKLIQLYDVLFLRDERDYIFDSQKLRPESIEPAVEIFKGLLRSFANKMEAESEIRRILEGLIENNDQLEAIVISAATFIRTIAQKNYQAFANIANRQADLKKWLFTEYDKAASAKDPKSQDFGELFSYLLHMNRGRRFGVQMVVDGLQGGMMRALATAEHRQGFFKQVFAEETENRTSIKALNLPVKELNVTSNSFALDVAAGGRAVKDSRFLPFFKSIFRMSGSYISDQGVATTPTISVRNLPIAKTGADVAGFGGTGIPNFHFVDRLQNRAYYFFGNDALMLEPLAEKNGLKTMPQRLSQFNSMNCNSQYDRGVRHSLDALLNLIIGEKSRDFGELLCFAELQRRSEAEIQLRKDRETVMSNIVNGRSSARWFATNARTVQLLNAIAENTELGMPEYLLVYNPWPDHFAHFTGPFSDEILSPTGELNRLDYWLSKFRSLYVKAEVNDRTLWSMAGDHGLTPVHYAMNLEKYLFDRMREEGMNLRVKKISSDEGGPPLITHPDRWPSMKDYDVIVASTAGGNYMIDLFNSQENTEWQKQPILSELRQWKNIDGRSIDIVGEIQRRLGESLDYMVVRGARLENKKSTTILLTTRNGERVTERILRDGDRFFYESSPNDLLQISVGPRFRFLSTSDILRKRELREQCIFGARLNDSASWCNRLQWLELTSLTDRPDSVVQLAKLYEEDRAGTINLFPRAGFGYNTEVPGRHAGEHFHEKDAFVGFWAEGAAGLRIKRITGTRRVPLVNGTLAPTIFEYLTGQSAIAGVDGWGFPSVFRAAHEQDRHGTK